MNWRSLKQISLHVHVPACTIDPVSLQSASLYLSSIDSGFSCHSKWQRSIRTVHFTFGYVRCSLNALPCSKYMYCITSAILTNCGQSFRTSNEHQPGCLQTTEVFTNTVYRACRVSRQEYSLSLRLTPMAYCNFKTSKNRLMRPSLVPWPFLVGGARRGEEGRVWWITRPQRGMIVAKPRILTSLSHTL